MGKEISQRIRRFDRLVKDFLDEKTRYLLLPENIKADRKELWRAKSEVSSCQQAMDIIQKVGDFIQEQTHSQVSNIVSKCLKAIYQKEAYEFHLMFKKSGTRSSVDMYLTRNNQRYEMRHEVGGGVLEVVAFALRVSMIILSQPPVRKIMILDEPFKNIRGQEYRSRVRDMIIMLSEELDIQFLINIDTDVYSEFSIGKVITL